MKEILKRFFVKYKIIILVVLTISVCLIAKIVLENSEFSAIENNIIEEKLSNKINAICNKIIDKTLKLNIDVFDFCRILKNKYPEYFKKIENKWKALLPYLKYEISQETKLKVTGKEPV